MPQYDFRCKSCSNRFSLIYKKVELYEKAAPSCPDCGSTGLSRLIAQVTIPKSDRAYGKMSSGEMLSVLESGDKRQIDEMYRQVGGDKPE